MLVSNFMKKIFYDINKNFFLAFDREILIWVSH